MTATPQKTPVSFVIRKKYALTSYILFFFTFALVGYLWEVGLHLVQTGELVNRGVLLGPWLPIYGSGGVLVLLVLKPIFEKPILTFFSSMALCSAIEYFTSWYLEFTQGQRWWDYSGYFLNLNGRICLEGAIIFGIGCCAVIYLLAPTLAKVYEKLPPKPTALLCVVLVGTFTTDVAWSHFHPNTGEGVTEASVSPAVVQLTEGVSCGRSLQGRLCDQPTRGGHDKSQSVRLAAGASPRPTGRALVGTRLAVSAGFAVVTPPHGSTHLRHPVLGTL